MEHLDLTFIHRFRSAVFVYGKNELTNSFLENLKKVHKDNDLTNFSFRATETLALPPKKNKIYNSKDRNEGLLRSNWLKKRLELIPSAVIFVSDLREGKEGGFLAEYSKYKDNLRSRNITSIFLFLVNKNQNFDEQIGNIKRILETDSKNIFFLPQSFETNIPQLAKLDKILQEASKNYFNELLKKHKRRIPKSAEQIFHSEFQVRILLKVGILYEFLLKTDKSQASFEEAYEIMMNTLFPFYLQKIHSASKSFPENFYVANFENIHRFEELRYLADLAKIRLFYQAVQKNDIDSAQKIFSSHLRTCRDKFDLLDTRFRYKEYKWKAGLYYYVSNILLNAYENNPKLVFFDANYISSRVIAFCDANTKRRETLLANNQNLLDEKIDDSLVISNSYLGFDRYKNPETGSVEIPKPTDINFINQILKHELTSEIHTNVNEVCIDLLKRLLKNMKIKTGEVFLTEFALAQQYYLNGEKQKFLELIPYILNSLEKNGWKTMVKDLLNKNEKFLVENNDWEGLISNCLKFCIFSQDTPEIESLLQKAIANSTKSTNFEFNIINQALFKIGISFEPKIIKYLHDFQGKIEMRIPECLKECIQTVEFIFNDPKYHIEQSIDNFIQEDGKNLLTFSMSATHLVPNNRLSITQIIFKGQKANQNNDSKSTFTFVLQENAFLSNQDNILLLQLVDDLSLKIESNQPGYTNEKVDILLRLRKKDVETQIKSVSVYLYVYERGRIHDIVPGFFPRDITMYFLNEDSTLTEVHKDTNLSMLEFKNDQQEMLLNFAVKATAEGKVTFVFKVKYDVIKIENGKTIEIPKELTEYFNSKTLAPFMHYLNWKTNLKEINHVKDSKTTNYRHPLPLNNTSCLNITFASIYHDVIIQNMKVNLNKNSQALILKEPSAIQNLVLLKNQLYTTHLLLKPIEEAEDLSLGNLELYIQRKEHELKTEKEPIIINVSLENISIHKRAFTVTVQVDTSCVVGCQTTYQVTISNNTNHLHKVDFTMMPNETFYFSGHSKYVLDILPRSSKEIKLQMIPVEIGKHRAPICIIRCLTLENETLLDTEETRIIYVYPQSEEALI